MQRYKFVGKEQRKTTLFYFFFQKGGLHPHLKTTNHKYKVSYMIDDSMQNELFYSKRATISIKWHVDLTNSKQKGIKCLIVAQKFA